MGFEITRHKPELPGATVTVRERVYLDAKGRATTDPAKGVKLFAPAGAVLPEAEAIRVGLVDDAPTVPEEPTVLEEPTATVEELTVPPGAATNEATGETTPAGDPLPAVEPDEAAKATPAKAPAAKDVRAWAKEQGIDVPDRGKLPDEVNAAYLDYQASVAELVAGGASPEDAAKSVLADKGDEDNGGNGSD